MEKVKGKLSVEKKSEIFLAHHVCIYLQSPITHRQFALEHTELILKIIDLVDRITRHMQISESLQQFERHANSLF